MSSLSELTLALHRECGASGTGGTVLTTGSLESARLTNWVIEAEYGIQALHVDWKFLWAEASVPTIGSQATLDTSDPSFPASVAFWDFCTFRLDGDPLPAVEHFEIRAETLDTTEGQPSRVIVMPDHTLKFEQVPDGVYTITADYYQIPTRLAASGDESVIPEMYDLAIIGRAMMMYGNYENASEIKIQGLEFYEEHLARLENRELPNKENARYKQGGTIQVIAG